MKNRRVATFVGVIFVIFGMFASSAFAEDDTDKKMNQEVDPEDPPPPPKFKKTRRGAASPCGFHANATYLVGQFSGSESSDSFVRDGIGFGINCKLNTRSRLSFVFGWEFYAGNFSLKHEEYSLKGSISSPEVGMKGWVKSIFNLHPVKLSAKFGMEKTNSAGFNVDSLDVAFGGGWFDLQDWSNKHLSVNGDLKIYEGAVDAIFPLPKRLAVTFGVKWQRYDVAVKVKVDEEGKDFLEAVNYDVDKVNRDFKNSADFIYLTPGVRWNIKKWETSLDVLWGVYQADDWSWGVTLGGGRRF